MMPERLSTSSSSLTNLIKIIIFVLISFIGIFLLGNIYSNASKNNKINEFNQKRFEDFYSYDENLDLIFLGSSHSYCTFDPEIFDTKLNINSFQLGMPLQHPDASYFTLLEVLNYQKPKAIILEIYWDLLQDDFDMKQADTLFAYLNNPSLKKQFVSEVFPLNEKVKYNFNTMRFQQEFFIYENTLIKKNIEQKYNLKTIFSETLGEEYYKSKGYVFADYILNEDEYFKNNQFKNLDGGKFSISKIQKSYIEKIVNKSKEENIELFFVMAPVANISMNLIKNYDYIYNEVNKMSQEFGISYTDYNIINQNENLLENENFRDDAHLNHSGVEIISNDFINRVLNKN